MSKSSNGSALFDALQFGGSNVMEATREVLHMDALSSLRGCSTPLALALGLVMGWRTETLSMNLTAKWLAEHHKVVYATLVSHIASKMQRSRELGVVEDHVQEFLTKLVKDDRLAEHLGQGNNPKLSVLRVWAYQSACTELRRWGTDAALRATRNARTAREVEQGKEFHPVQSASVAHEIPHEEGESQDLCDPTAPTPEDTLARKSQVEHVRASLIRRGQAHLVPVVDGLLEGVSLAELVAIHGVSGEQLATVLRGIRAA